MANTLYDKGRQRFAEAALNWPTDTLKQLIVSSAYVPNFSTHEFLSDISSSARVSSTTGVTLTSKSTTGGACDAADVTNSAVSGSVVVEVIFSRKGLGRQLFQAVQSQDLPLVLGITLVVAAGYVLANILVDLIYELVDPRLQRSAP